MTKQEFLDELRNALTGQVSSESVMDAYRYYSDYIDMEVRTGKSESQVIEELGKPAFIAKSIIAAQAGERQADVEYTEDGKTRKIYQGKTDYHKSDSTKKEFHFRLNSWYGMILGILLLLFLIVVVFFILKWSIILLVTFGIPILLLLGIIYLIMYFIRE